MVSSFRLACSFFVIMLTAAAFAQTPRDTVVMAKQIDDIISIDPGEAFEYSSAELVLNVYDTLVRVDPANPTNVHPSLAESWSIEDNGSTFIFKLRPNLSFHSGNPITATDVVSSIARILRLNKAPVFIIRQLGLTAANVAERVVAVDPLTVRFTFDKAYAPSLVLTYLATYGWIVDSKLIAAQEKDGDSGNAWLKLNSAGSGAYQLRSFRAHEQYTLEANPNWHGGAPKTQRIVVRHVPEPTIQRLLLEKGDVDYARNLTQDQLVAIAGNPDLVIASHDKAMIVHMSLNRKHSQLAKPAVIQALKHLIDYEGINRLVSTTFRPHQSYLAPTLLGAITDTPFHYDFDKAKRLLAEAGVPDGFTMTMDVRSIPPFIDLAQAIQASWARAGVKLELVPGDGAQVFSKFRARRHDSFIGIFGGDVDPHTNAESFAANADNSDDAPIKLVAWRNHWSDPELTAQVQSLKTERDTARRAAGYQENQRRFQEVSPIIILFHTLEVVARRKSVDGLIIGVSVVDCLYWSIVKK